MSTYFTILTNAGLAKIANAQALGTVVQWSEMAVGDGNGNDTTPVQTQTALVRERFRAQLNQLATDPNNPNWLVAELVIPSAQGGWTVREVGVYDEAGDLVAVANFPATYKPQLAEGASKDLVIRVIIEVANTAVVQLRIDPSVVLASRSWVVNQFLLRSKVAGGTTGQVLRKTGNADEAFAWQDITAANITVNTVQELQTLAANQTVIDWATITTSAAAYYIGGARLEPGDFTVNSATRITLARSYPAGTRILGAINEPAGSPVEFVPVSGGGSRLPVGSRRMITDSLTYTLPSTVALTAGAAVVVEKTATASPTISVGAGGALINNNTISPSTSYVYNQSVRLEFVFDGVNWLARPMLRQAAFGVGGYIDLRQVYAAQFSTPQLCFGKGMVRGFIDGLALGIPDATSISYGVLVIDGQYEDSSGQAAVQQSWINGSGTRWTRSAISATGWTRWFKVFTEGNIIGTVSQTAGVPTGAIIQRGSNVNGEFTIFADGRAIALRYDVQTTSNPNVADGQIFVSSNMEVSFPVTFTGTVAKTVEFSGPRTEGCWVINPIGSGTSSFWRFRIAASRSIALLQTPMNLMAVGQVF